MKLRQKRKLKKSELTDTLTKDNCFICKAEEGGVAVATPTDDNAADGKSLPGIPVWPETWP